MNFQIRSRMMPVLAATLLVFVAACKKDEKIIQKVTFQPSDNLEVVRITAHFGKKIKSNLTGGFAIKDYGYLFINPYTESNPFQVGFDLNTSIVNEQDYVDLTPTTVFPNGVSMGLPHAVVQVSSPTPISPLFDLYGYVDVLHQSWLGVAAMLNFIDDQYFPPDLAVTLVFLRNDEGHPGVIASAFGPDVSDDGAITRAGGLAVLANVRQLVEDLGGQPRTLTFYPEKQIKITGPEAEYYKRNPHLLLEYQSKIAQKLNQL